MQYYYTTSNDLLVNSRISHFMVLPGNDGWLGDPVSLLLF